DTVDLVPDYLPKLPDQHWYLAPDGGNPCLLRQAPQGKTYVRFDFIARPAGGADGEPGGAGWKKIDIERKVSTLDLPAPPEVGAATLPEAQLWENKLKVMDGRIARTHGRGVVDYYRTKASLLHRLGRADQVAQVIEQAMLAVPDHYWPLLAAAVLDSTPVTIPETLEPTSQPAATTTAPAAASQAATTEAVATTPATASAPAIQPLAPAPRLVAWARENPSFTHDFYVAWFFSQRRNSGIQGDDLGRLAAVRLALDEACKYPLEVDVDDSAKYEFYGFEAARMAYRVGAYDTVLKIAQRWQERAALDGPRRDESYLAWRAAAELGLGQVEKARTDAAAAVERGKDFSLWADHLDELAAAAQRGDTKFIYPPAVLGENATNPATNPAAAPRPRVPAFELFGAE
ncbi:MAG: hypothetical protein WCI73_19330, partial [Phycisphaerae bacterium]